MGAAGLVLLTVTASCAAISGIDEYKQGTCAGSCDGSGRPSPASTTDGASEASQGDDAPVVDNGDDANDATVTNDATTAAEASDESAVGAKDGPEPPMEAATSEASGGDCEVLTSITNCSACGVSCDMSTGTPSCDGTKCNYACTAGRQDCNGSKAPNTDGCECVGNGCCGSRCQTAHSNGANAVFFDCNPAGTQSKTQAQEACAAATGSSGACTSSTTSCCIAFFCATPAQSVCGTVNGNCYCWQYAGPAPGTVQQSSGGGSNCSASCGSPGDATWN